MSRLLWKKLFPKHTDRHYNTVRVAFPLVIISLLFSGLASIISENSSYVTIRTKSDTVSQDQQFFIDVFVTAHVPINAIDLVIAYPREQMKIDSIDTGTSVITLWAKKPYAENGNIYIRGATYRKGFLGEHQVARIRAHATEPGTAKVIVKQTQLLAGDGLGTKVNTSVSETLNEAKIQVQGTGGAITAHATISVVTDTDGDGDVDFADITKFMSAWITRSAFFDFNGDGKMTFKDFSILLADSFFR